ncbi:MAG: choice-of-anchor R domain-containing protein [Gemmatimonadota bacterium]
MAVAFARCGSLTRVAGNAGGFVMAGAFTVAAMVSTVSKAEVILYNNWQNQAGQQQFQGTGRWFSQSFTTGTSAANLDTVSVMVRNESGSSGSIGVEIYSSTGGNLPMLVPALGGHDDSGVL